MLDKKRNKIFFLAWLLFASLASNAQNVEVLVSGIRSTKGQISIGVFKDDKSFQSEKAFLLKKFQKTAVSKGQMTVKFDLEPGIYGLSLLDDENNDGNMKYKLFGIPDEGFGFSNYEFSGFKKPKFDMFKFVLNKNQNHKIVMKVKYM